ncbi:MAG: hypothetical protein AB8F78_16410 [Saprospiraceae bacterium]
MYKSLTQLILGLVVTVILTASSCEGNDPFINTPEEEAARILANTPTELPPITTTGENTMGAWIILQPGSELALEAGTDSILFVASGVERIDPIGASSTDCDAFQNFRYESQGYVDILGRWCPRPEIGDPKWLTLGFLRFDNDRVMVTASIDLNGGRTVDSKKFRNDSIGISHFSVLLDDATNRILSATFSGELYGWDNTSDTIQIESGRLDARYGITP